MPSEISKDLTHFTSDPRPMLEHRDRVARMIERLGTSPTEVAIRPVIYGAAPGPISFTCGDL